VRRILGRPGSVRRWTLANLVVLPLAIASMNFYLVVSVVLLSTMWIMYLRTTIVEGDEDEMGAWLRWQTSSKNPDRLVATEETGRVVDSTDWLNARRDTFLGVPLPPVAEPDSETEAGDAGDTSSEGAPW